MTSRDEEPGSIPAFCIIKPEAFPLRDEIWARIVSTELHVVRRCVLTLNEDQAVGFYRSLPENRRLPAVRSLSGGPVEVGVLAGDNAVARVLRLCGTRSDPSECEPGTIRRDFGTGWDLSDPSVPVLRNAIHRCKTSAQVEDSIAWLERIRSDR